jgi:DNA-binding transcriptional LysR family regulator
MMGFRDNELESPPSSARAFDDMQLKDLQWFRTAVELGNLHSAAEAIGVTQPALSKSIQRLETSLGVRLLERTPRGVAPTSIGMALHARAQLLGQMVDDTRHQIHDMKTGQSGELRIGTVPAIVESVMSPVLASFLEGEAAVRFQTSVQLSSVLLHQLESGALDFAIAAVAQEIAPALNCTVLGEQQSFVVARKGHPLLRRRFDLHDLAAQSWVLPPSNIALRAWLDAMFAEAGIDLPPAFLQADASPAVFAPLVRSTHLLTVMTADSLDTTLGAGLAALPAPAPVWTLQVGLFWRRNAYFSALMREFRDRVVSVFRQRDARLNRKAVRVGP